MRNKILQHMDDIMSKHNKLIEFVKERGRFTGDFKEFRGFKKDVTFKEFKEKVLK